MTGVGTPNRYLRPAVAAPPRFTTLTESVVAARSKVAPEMVRAITRTVLFDHTAASSSINRVPQHDKSAPRQMQHHAARHRRRVIAGPRAKRLAPLIETQRVADRLGQIIRIGGREVGRVHAAAPLGPRMASATAFSRR